MKTQAEMKKKLKSLLADERIHYEPALLEINAPLALIQTHTEAQIRILEWALELPPTPLMKEHKAT